MKRGKKKKKIKGLIHSHMRSLLIYIDFGYDLSLSSLPIKILYISMVNFHFEQT